MVKLYIILPISKNIILTTLNFRRKKTIQFFMYTLSCLTMLFSKNQSTYSHLIHRYLVYELHFNKFSPQKMILYTRMSISMFSYPKKPSYVSIRMKFTHLGGHNIKKVVQLNLCPRFSRASRTNLSVIKVFICSPQC